MTGSAETIRRGEQALFDLVATPSVSGSESAAARVFVRHAHSMGLLAEIDEAGNAIAHRGPGDAPIQIMLLGHIDTVPGDLPVFIEDGFLYGRGSVDAKGPLSAMLIAAAQATLPPGVRVSIAGAVGEEIAGSPGARYLVNQHRPAACIIGEPSGWDGVTLGYKGCVSVTARCKRGLTHSAGPDASAADELLAWWSEALRFTQAFNAGRVRQFDRLQATVRDMGVHDDALSQRGHLRASFRLPPGLDSHELVSSLVELAPAGIEVAHEGAESAVVSDRNDPVVRALTSGIRSAGGKPCPKLKTGTADFNVVAPIWRCPIAAYGPGDSTLDHTPDEHLSLDEFWRSVEVLGSAVMSLAEELQNSSPSVCGHACTEQFGLEE